MDDVRAFYKKLNKRVKLGILQIVLIENFLVCSLLPRDFKLSDNMPPEDKLKLDDAICEARLKMLLLRTDTLLNIWEVLVRRGIRDDEQPIENMVIDNFLTNVDYSEGLLR